MYYNIPKYCLIFFLSLHLLSCQINGNFKGLTSYRTEIEKANPSIISNNIFDCDKKYNKENRLFILNGNQLKKCLSLSDTALVYIWKPKCKGKYCLDLNAIQNFCMNKNIRLYVVAEYYDLNEMAMPLELKNPIIGVDTYYYKTNYTKSYITKFFNDILDNDFKYENYSYYLFINSKLTDQFNDIYILKD